MISSACSLVRTRRLVPLISRSFIGSINEDGSKRPSKDQPSPSVGAALDKYGIKARMERLGHLNIKSTPYGTATSATARSSLDNLNVEARSVEARPAVALKSPSAQTGGQQPPSCEEGRATTKPPKGVAAIENFNKTPREVKAFLDRFVVAQHDAKKALAVALCDHYNHARRCLADPAVHARNYVKPNVLVLGPSGCGKTHLVRTMAQLIGVPFVKCDATKFSATGYVGGDVEDPVRSLVAAAHGDVALAEFGIVYVDEIDKIAFVPGGVGGATSVNTRDVQTSLLKLMEDGEVTLKDTDAGAQPPRRSPPPTSWRGPGATGRGGVTTTHHHSSSNNPYSPHGSSSGSNSFSNGNSISSGGGNNYGSGNGSSDSSAGGVEAQSVVRTKHVLFIFSGAFNALRANVASEEELAATGASSESGTSSSSGSGRDATVGSSASTSRSGGRFETHHFVDAGMEPEFMGRVPVRVACDHLATSDLVGILARAEDSVLHQFTEDFKGYGIDLSMDEPALEAVAELAVGQGTGARGLLTVLDSALREFKFELPGTATTSLHVDANHIRDPRSTLENLLAKLSSSSTTSESQSDAPTR